MISLGSELKEKLKIYLKNEDNKVEIVKLGGKPTARNHMEKILYEVIDDIDKYWDFNDEKPKNIVKQDKLAKVKEAIDYLKLSSDKGIKFKLLYSRNCDQIDDLIKLDINDACRDKLLQINDNLVYEILRYKKIEEILEFFDLYESIDELMRCVISKAYVDNKDIFFHEVYLKETETTASIEYVEKIDIKEDEQLLFKKDVFKTYVVNDDTYDFKLSNQHSNFYKFVDDFNLCVKSGFKRDKDAYITDRLGYFMAYLYKRKQLDNHSQNKANKFLKKHKLRQISNIKYTEFKSFIQEFREILLYPHLYMYQLKNFDINCKDLDIESGRVLNLIKSSNSSIEIDEMCVNLHRLEQTLKFIQLEELSILRSKLAHWKITKEVQAELYRCIFEAMFRLDCIFVLFILKKINQKITKKNAVKLIKESTLVMYYMSRIYNDLLESVNHTGELLEYVDSEMLQECKQFLIDLFEDNNGKISSTHFRYVIKQYGAFYNECGMEIYKSSFGQV